MIENIAKGRLGKFLKEVCLLNQEDIMDGKKTVRETMKEIDPEVTNLGVQTFSLCVLNNCGNVFDIKKKAVQPNVSPFL